MKNQLCFCFLYFTCISWLNAEPLVTCSQGTLNGTIHESRNGRKFSAFLGIPFGEPPIGDLRQENTIIYLIFILHTNICLKNLKRGNLIKIRKVIFHIKQIFLL